MDTPALAPHLHAPPRVDAAALRDLAGGPALERLLRLSLRAVPAEVASVTLAGEPPVTCTCGNADLPVAHQAQLHVEDGEIGTLGVGRRDTGRWDPDDLQALRGCADAIEDHLERGLRDARRQAAAADRERLYRDIALETSALQHVATVVARTTNPREVYDAVCRELPTLVGVPMSAVSRFQDGRSPEMLATVGIDFATADQLCAALWGRGATAAAEAYRLGSTFHVDDTRAASSDDAERYAGSGIRSVVGAPVFVQGALWGAITVGSAKPGAVRPESAGRLKRFAELIALAVSNAEARARLAEQATSDSLTGLPNHRRFHEELHNAVAQATRHNLPVAVALVDIDRFKQVNDTLGHEGGDQVLRALAYALRETHRDGELVARLGGDEFAAILPGSDDLGAEAFAHRLRRCLDQHPAIAGNHITVSVGVADLTHARDVASLLRLADGALYWAKEQGRDAVWRYSPEVVISVSERDRADRLARNQALTALRGLARAIDLRDPSCQRHAERVATLAQQMAAELSWDVPARERLGEAALLHDIGKVAVPDPPLHKPAALESDEYDLVRKHAHLGAEIVSEALDDEQVGWVNHHHERFDGTGYPAGLAGDDIPLGACIIGVAEAFDVMTTAGHYRRPVGTEEALAECRRERGRQFAPRAVDALVAVVGAGS